MYPVDQTTIDAWWDYVFEPWRAFWWWALGFTRTQGAKLNDQPVGEFFVLAEHDPYAPEAVLAYADACEKEKPDLAEGLRLMADRWEVRRGMSA